MSGAPHFTVAPEPAEEPSDGGSVALLPDWELLESRGLDRDLRQWVFPFNEPAWWHNLGTCQREGCPNPARTSTQPPAALELRLRATGRRLCSTCENERWELSKAQKEAISVDAFLERVGSRPDSFKRKVTRLRLLCRICCILGRERPTASTQSGLCSNHGKGWGETRKSGSYSTVEQWIEDTKPEPLPTFGRCVASVREGTPCPDWAKGGDGVCSAHSHKYYAAMNASITREEWLSKPHPFGEISALEVIDLARLTPRQFTEVCWNISQELRENTRVDVKRVKVAVKWLSRRDVSIADLNPDDLPGGANGDVLRRWMLQTARTLSDRGREARRDVVRLAVLDPQHNDKATLWVEDVTQPWLREALALRLLHLASEGASQEALRSPAKAARWWSAYQRTQPGEGNDPNQLTSDIACSGFATWLDGHRDGYVQWLGLAGAKDPASLNERTRLARAHFRPSKAARYAEGDPADQGRDKGSNLRVTARTKATTLNKVKALLNDQHDYLKSVGAGWRFKSRDIPSREQTEALSAQEQGKEGQGKSLPSIVYAQLGDRLPLLGEGQPRNLVDFVYCTGRRPEDTVEAKFDCLIERGYMAADGQLRSHTWLRYTDRLKDGKGGHPWQIPLYETAVNVIRRQQGYLRGTHPQWFDEDGHPLNPDLRLFPTPGSNPHGIEGIGSDRVSKYLAQMLGKQPITNSAITAMSEPLIGPDGEPFPLARVTAYALRHTFGQQLWDAGVAIDIIQQLMGHDDIASTQIYAQPNDEALIGGMDAVEKLRVAAIDERGEVVMLGMPSLIPGHDEVTSALMGCGRCANKGRVGQNGGACLLNGDCPNCVDWRNSVAELPALHRERRRIATAVASYDAGLTAHTPKTRNAAQKSRDDVDTLDQIITALERELDTNDHITEDERRQVHDLIELNEQIEVEILEPLGQQLGLMRMPVHRRMQSPLAVEESMIDLTDNRNETFPAHGVSFRPQESS